MISDGKSYQSDDELTVTGKFRSALENQTTF